MWKNFKYLLCRKTPALHINHFKSFEELDNKIVFRI